MDTGDPENSFPAMRAADTSEFDATRETSSAHFRAPVFMHLARRGQTLLWWAVWIVWIPVFTPAIIGLIEARPPAPQSFLSLAGALLFFALYLRYTWLCARDLAHGFSSVRPTGMALWTPIAIMAALSLTLTLWNGQDWGGLFIFTATCAAG